MKKRLIIIGIVVTAALSIVIVVIDRELYLVSSSDEDYINAFYREAQVYGGILKSYQFFDTYEISYPENYEVLDGKYERSILLTSPNYEKDMMLRIGHEVVDMIQGHSILIREIRRSLSPEDALSYFWDYKDERPVDNITLGGRQGQLHITLSGPILIKYQAATILDNGISYVITAEWVGEEERKQAIDAFYTIMTSFRFIE